MKVRGADTVAVVVVLVSDLVATVAKSVDILASHIGVIATAMVLTVASVAQLKQQQKKWFCRHGISYSCHLN